MKKSHSLVFATLLFSDEIDAQWKPALVECDVEVGGVWILFFQTGRKIHHSLSAHIRSAYHAHHALSITLPVSSLCLIGPVGKHNHSLSSL